MKAPDFEYHRPVDLSAALALMGGGEAMALAGGQSLLPMMHFRVSAPEALVDLNGLAELRGIEQRGDVLRIGAMTRSAELLSDEAVRTHAPLIAMALPHVAHDAIRNRGTIGGSLALADPAAEMPAAMLALGASVEVAGPGGPRTIPADEFFLGYYETALEPGELIVAVHVPVARPDQAFGFHELTQRHGDYALAGVCAARTGDAFRVAFFGVTDRAVRARAVEEVLSVAPDDVAGALRHLSKIDFAGDLKASAGMRRRLAGVALTRALEGMR